WLLCLPRPLILLLLLLRLRLPGLRHLATHRFTDQAFDLCHRVAIAVRRRLWALCTAEAEYRRYGKAVAAARVLLGLSLQPRFRLHWHGLRRPPGMANQHRSLDCAVAEVAGRDRFHRCQPFAPRCGGDTGALWRSQFGLDQAGNRILVVSLGGHRLLVRLIARSGIVTERIGFLL